MHDRLIIVPSSEKMINLVLNLQQGWVLHYELVCLYASALLVHDKQHTWQTCWPVMPTIHWNALNLWCKCKHHFVKVSLEISFAHCKRVHQLRLAVVLRVKTPLTWAVQMLLVALSRLMCCSRVWRANLRASLLFASLKWMHWTTFWTIKI